MSAWTNSMTEDKTRKNTKINVARNYENHSKPSSFFSLNIRCSSQPYTIKYTASTSDRISDFASSERTKKIRYLQKHGNAFLKSLFYLILRTDKWTIFMRNKS